MNSSAHGHISTRKLVVLSVSFYFLLFLLPLLFSSMLQQCPSSHCISAHTQGTLPLFLLSYGFCRGQLLSPSFPATMSMSSSSFILLPAPHFIAQSLSASVFFMHVQSLHQSLYLSHAAVIHSLAILYYSLFFLHSFHVASCVCFFLPHYSITWRCCIWCVWWSSCSLPLRPINRSLNHVAFVLCICISGRPLWWLLGRLYGLLIPNWCLSLLRSSYILGFPPFHNV